MSRAMTSIPVIEGVFRDTTFEDEELQNSWLKPTFMSFQPERSFRGRRTTTISENHENAQSAN
jgi:hypothetical protein